MPPAKKPAPSKKYGKLPTDFDQVATFNQILANLVERNRKYTIAQMLDHILEEGGMEMENMALMNRANKLSMRMDMYKPAPHEDAPADV